MSMSFDAGRSSRPAPPNDPMRNSHPREPVRKPPGGTLAHTREPIPPFSDFVEVQCEDCNGTGYDFGSHKDFDPEYCPRCGGSGMELVFPHYPAEAFQNVSDSPCQISPCPPPDFAPALLFPP